LLRTFIAFVIVSSERCRIIASTASIGTGEDIRSDTGFGAFLPAQLRNVSFNKKDGMTLADKKLVAETMLLNVNAESYGKFIH
jgi:hypothetical protein